jgi:hypothetical protein
LLIDPLERTCTLFTEPKHGKYSVRQIVKFGESLLIPASDSTVELESGHRAKVIGRFPGENNSGHQR